MIEKNFSSELNAKPEHLDECDCADTDAKTEDTSNTRQKPENILSLYYYSSFLQDLPLLYSFS